LVSGKLCREPNGLFVKPGEPLTEINVLPYVFYKGVTNWDGAKDSECSLYQKFNKLLWRHKCYYYSGEQKANLTWDADFRIRHWRFWYKDGTKMAEGDSEQGKKLGKWKYWDPSGSPCAEFNVNEATEKLDMR